MTLIHTRTLQSRLWSLPPEMAKCLRPIPQLPGDDTGPFWVICNNHSHHAALYNPCRPKTMIYALKQVFVRWGTTLLSPS